MSIIEFEGQHFRAHAVTARLSTIDDQPAVRIERDLDVIPFDVTNMVNTVDEPTYLVLTDSDGADLDFTDAVIEVEMHSTLLQPSLFAQARGFIGVAFRVAPDDSAFEAIYLRPTLGRSYDQVGRNHSVQYFAHPDHKFARLRAEAPGRYETWADIGMDEWTTMRVEVSGHTARLYLNDSSRPGFVVSELLGKRASGGVGLFVDIGTIGHFRNLKVTQAKPKIS